MAESIEINSDAGRFDVLVEVGKTHPDGSVELTFRPHPDRYIWRDDETEGRVLYDVKTRTVFPESVLRDMTEQMMAGIPFYMPPDDLPDAEDLLAERKAAIEAYLSGANPDEELARPSEAELANMVGEQREVAALSVDLVDSTRLQASDRAAYGTLVPLLLREIAAVTANFGGVVVNFTGDGAIVAFPGPGSTVANDMAFDAATALVADIYLVLNPAAKAAGLPGIDIRVGLDANEGEATTVGSETSRRQLDMLGLALSMAAKVQSRAAPREVWVGQMLYETLHVSRQEKLSRASPGKAWDFVDRSGQPYALYHFPMAPPLPTADS